MRSRSSAFFAVVALAVGVACCGLMPERYALNAPLGNLIFGWSTSSPPSNVFERRVRVPRGFTVGIFADGIANARMLRFTAGGDLLVSAPRKGNISLVEPDRDGDGRSDGVRTVLDGRNAPHGLDLHDGWLYVAERDGVMRVRFDESAGTTHGAVETIVTGLPSGGNHWMRTLRFGPDEHLYVSVGSSCNACIEKDERRAALLRYQPDGSGGEIWARGLRNAVDFDWQPETGRLYATDNGRDLLGDDFPPCELNLIERGGFYGWPFANGDRVPDPIYGKGRADEVARSIPPVHGFGPHTAPLGITFLRDPRWPAEYRGAAAVALHGSWNRTRKVGYKVVTLHWRDDGSIEERDFLVGLEENEDVIGRPVAVAEGPDGALYISDDYAGVIYRVASEAEPKQAVAMRRNAPATAGRAKPPRM